MADVDCVVRLLSISTSVMIAVGATAAAAEAASS